MQLYPGTKLTGSQYRFPIPPKDKPIWVSRLDSVLAILLRIDHANPKETHENRDLSQFSVHHFVLRVLRAYHKTKPKTDSPNPTFDILVEASENNEGHNTGGHEALSIVLFELHKTHSDD